MVGRLIREKGVASVPMSAFSHDNADHGIIRFCFARSEKLLKKAAKLICEL